MAIPRANSFIGSKRYTFLLPDMGPNPQHDWFSRWLALLIKAGMSRLIQDRPITPILESEPSAQQKRRRHIKFTCTKINTNLMVWDLWKSPWMWGSCWLSVERQSLVKHGCRTRLMSTTPLLHQA